jgi:hypothetical protein
MLWKSRWSGGWSLRRVVDQPNRARIQGNQILISAYDETINRSCIYSRLRLVNFPSGRCEKFGLAEFSLFQF